MVTYAYVREKNPPAPFVHAAVRTLDGSRSTVELPAQIDPGADRTVLPAALVEQLQLVPNREITLRGFGGVLVSSPIFLVTIQVRGLESHDVEAASNPDEPHVLLGRGILNHHRLILDGPQLSLKIE
jgi:hypothetical protein